MTARLGEGGFDDERRMCDEETSSEGDKNTELNVEAAVCSGTECCPCVSACLCVCGHVRKKIQRTHLCPCVYTLTDRVFSEGIDVFLCYIAAGEAPLQSCPSGSPDYISKH